MIALIVALAQIPSRMVNEWFDVLIAPAGITSLKHVQDVYNTDYLASGKALGVVDLKWRAQPTDPWLAGGKAGVEATSSFSLQGQALVWNIDVRNKTTQTAEVGDMALPLPFATNYGADREDTYTNKLVRHSFVGGDGSFIYWTRANGVGPYLVMVPQRGTGLECFEGTRDYRVYIHSTAIQEQTKAKGGTWTLPPTEAVLKAGAVRRYSFRFRWAADYDDVRRKLVQEGGVDVHVAPGMTTPTDLDVLLVANSKHSVNVRPQFPDQTAVQKQRNRYRLRFARLGENTIWLNYDHGRRMALEFFVTEPIETLIRKRAAFLVSHEQHRDPTKWYDGLYSEWDMKAQVLRGPENLGTLRPYMVASDDPILGRAPFLATKNVYYPDQAEIDSLELYLSKYVWGGLQQTTEEPFPYAVYGIDNWHQLRNSPKDDDKGKKHVWRIYDYPHMIALYYEMYRLAKDHPEMTHYLDAAGYLERARGTAMAYFEVPSMIIQWSAYDTGTYNEVVIPDLIEALEREGRRSESEALRAHWERKVETFINDKPNLYGSEYAFDSTGFESTERLARYAMERLDSSGGAAFRSKVDPVSARRFLELQIGLNVVDRGELEPAYYWMGSDYRGSGNSQYLLSYMSQMGGWGVTDFGLHFAKEPAFYLRLGSASYLSSWSLVNSGTPASNYGFWYPGKENDGAASGGFEPQPWNRPWLGRYEMGRGAWEYSGEIDLGFTGALRAAATIVTNDPVFGPVAYGGNLERHGSNWQVVPRDGLRARFHVVLGDHRLSLELDRDGFAAERPIVFDEGLKSISFELENRGGGAHSTRLKIDRLPKGRYVIESGGSAKPLTIGETEIPITATSTTPVTIRRQ